MFCRQNNSSRQRCCHGCCKIKRLCTWIRWRSISRGQRTGHGSCTTKWILYQICWRNTSSRQISCLCSSTTKCCCLALYRYFIGNPLKLEEFLLLAIKLDAHLITFVDQALQLHENFISKALEKNKDILYVKKWKCIWKNWNW